MPAFAGTMQVENLNRGLIAVRKGSGYYLSWRLLANEPYNTGFNVYRGTTKLNSTPITGATVYTDASAAQNSSYTVRAVLNNVEQAASPAAMLINNTDGPNANNNSGETAGYIQIDLQRPPTGAQGGTYSPGDGSTGDLDGDGVYEIVLKWDPSNAQDNSKPGTTDNVLIDAYTLSGTRLWRIDLGQNIRAGAHYTQFLVYDFDGDGKAEVMMKTAPGTKDGTGAYITKGPAASATHTTAYRNADGYVLSGPEYLTVFEGATGKELATVNYLPERGTVSSWGDNYGNRVDRFNAAVAYVDGERPSAIFQRGYYTRLTMVAWDWRNGQLTQRWTFDSNASGNSNYAGQGNHQLSVADVNNDGKHGIITGAAVIGSDGKGMHRTGYGHGDALHVAHMIKGNPIPQIYMPHENKVDGVLLRHANNGMQIFKIDKNEDVGRGCAAELDKNKPGFKFWASSGMGLYDITGAVIGNLPNNGNNTQVTNHIIWWDGELSRDLLDGNQITKWSVANNSGQRLLTAYGASSVNGSKSNPVLQADLFGDWREEVIFAYGTSALRIYTTMMPTTHRLVTLMHDPVYRVAVAWQNSSYNQPPHPGYYIASDMDFPPPTLNVAVVGDSEQPSSSSVAQSSSSDSGPTPTTWPVASHSNALNAMRNAVNLQITANADVQIFDLKGNIVRALNFAQGNYLVPLDLPQGLYIVKANSGSWSKTIKMPVTARN
jgi:rhamnogalacturonan endolyase